jgi:hypothetical protein
LLPWYRKALKEKDAQKATDAENIQKGRKTYNHVEEIVTFAKSSRQVEDVDDFIVREKENCFTKMTGDDEEDKKQANPTQEELVKKDPSTDKIGTISYAKRTFTLRKDEADRLAKIS